MKKNILVLMGLILIIFIFQFINYLFPPALAITLNEPLPKEAKIAEHVIAPIIRLILTITGSAALVMFVYGGFILITSGGTSNLIQKGKNILIWAVIGLLFVMWAGVIANWIITGLSQGKLPSGVPTLPPTTPGP
ncbi:MAG: hypothetical protein A2Y67_02295 [Candidatus Buchananbacteria bacterium RBG_13_39_9]|uniref:Uncharacterized protein n=1 Tax=Candidatus Buchananbacteria bacterium RBG_13_39_9 TaxID=1797531 RepID=A0A1G1XMX6_9BACT|nr:MAG: hypothetical protein A2Y67_02295 [Candidatus Buchananbacteria bacterium RBG_13_39_9]